MTDAQPITERLTRVRQQISDWCRQYRGTPDCAQLLAVSKTFPAEAIATAYAAGQRQFGESYIDEALDKIEALQDRAIEWHFIGPIQSNKTRKIAEHFAWVHSVDRLKIARRLAEQRPDSLPPLNICLQINTSNEASKSGMSPAELADTIAAVTELPRLQLRGLMAIPARSTDFAAQRAAFAQLRELRAGLIDQGYPLDTLSMGMSGDLKAAIAEGSTLVRVGSGIFGERQARFQG